MNSEERRQANARISSLQSEETNLQNRLSVIQPEIATLKNAVELSRREELISLLDSNMNANDMDYTIEPFADTYRLNIFPVGTGVGYDRFKVYIGQDDTTNVLVQSVLGYLNLPLPW